MTRYEIDEKEEPHGLDNAVGIDNAVGVELGLDPQHGTYCCPN